MAAEVLGAEVPAAVEATVYPLLGSSCVTDTIGTKRIAKIRTDVLMMTSTTTVWQRPRCASQKFRSCTMSGSHEVMVSSPYSGRQVLLASHQV